jgi:hypothetical protein
LALTIFYFTFFLFFPFFVRSTCLLSFFGGLVLRPCGLVEKEPKKMATRSAVLFCFFLVLHFLDATIAETEYYGTNWNDAAVEAMNEVLRILGRKRRKNIVLS